MIFLLSDFNLHICNSRVQLMVLSTLTVDSHLKVRVFHFIFILQTQQVLEFVLETDHLVLNRGDFLLHLDDLVILGLELSGPRLNKPVHLINLGLLSGDLEFKRLSFRNKLVALRGLIANIVVELVDF